MWKILTVQIRKIYHLLVSNRLFLKEQNECQSGTRKTGDILCVDQLILMESKTKQKNIAKA